MITARIIAITQPLEETGIPDAAALVAYCARVSNPCNQDNHATAGGLLDYCQRHGHWSPFEMTHVVMEIEAPRDIARQILRHRSFSFQEFSQRYAVALSMVRRHARRQDASNRQSSVDDLPAWKRAAWRALQASVARVSAVAYAQSLRMGVAKECARVLLPEGLTMSRLYMAGSLRSWLHYIAVRDGNGTQAEHAEVARLVRAALAPHFPSIIGSKA